MASAKPCRHCGHPVVPCRCHGHTPPMWKHTPSGHHRCGPHGTGATRAEPAATP